MSEQNWIQFVRDMLRIFEERGEEAKLTDEDLEKLENLTEALLSVFQFMRSEREQAYEEAGGVDTKGDKNKATHI